MGLLNDLGIKYHTDKCNKGPDFGYPFHDYCRHYEKLFEHLRFDKFLLVEIGIGPNVPNRPGGASLRMWKEYFPNAQIVGVDVLEECKMHEEDRIDVIISGGENPNLRKMIYEKYGKARIVIDDALHSWDNQRAILEGLFPLVEKNGYYICEDIVDHNYKGFKLPKPNIEHIPFFEYLKERLNCLKYESYKYFSEFTRLQHLPPKIRYVETHIDSVQFIGYSACIIQKNDSDDRIINCVTKENGLEDFIVSPNANYFEVFGKLKYTNSFAVAVCQNNKLLGIISNRESDIRKENLKNKTAGELMNTEFTVLNSFEQEICPKYLYYPVVNENNDFLGFRYELPME